MKKIPYSVIPLALVAVAAALFQFQVRPGGHLISDPVDTLLGGIVGVLLVACLVYDFVRFFPHKKWPDMPQGSGLAMGLALGIAIGVSLDNIGAGIAIGMGLGIAIDAQPKGK